VQSQPLCHFLITILLQNKIAISAPPTEREREERACTDNSHHHPHFHPLNTFPKGNKKKENKGRDIIRKGFKQGPALPSREQIENNENQHKF
jgi:hypothetical protein